MRAPEPAELDALVAPDVLPDAPMVDDPTPIAIATPERPVEPRPNVPALPPPDDVRTSFARGYHDAVAAGAYLASSWQAHVEGDVVPCESGWQLDPGNEWGLAQFSPATFAVHSQAGADWRDPYEQGFATARLIHYLLARGESPGSTAGWPHCWWVGL